MIVKKRGLGASRNISGRYHLCLNDNTLSLVRIGGGSNSNSTTNTNAAFNETATNQHPPLQHRASSQSIQPQPEELIEFPLIYIKRFVSLFEFIVKLINIFTYWIKMILLYTLDFHAESIALM